MGNKALESSLQQKIEVVPKPYYKKDRCDAWRCLHCSQVHLSIRLIEIHCATVHGIWKRKRTSTEVLLPQASPESIMGIWRHDK